MIFKTLWAEHKKKRAAKQAAEKVKLFQEMIAQRESGLMGLVEGVAQFKAQEYIKNWLDRKRVARCQFCISTEQLRRHGPGYICPAHLKAVQSENEKASTPTTAGSAK